MSSTEQEVATVEGEMARLSVNGWFAIELDIINACQEGAQFFAVEVREHRWIAAVDGRPFRTLHGYGSGPDVLTALASAEQTALSHSQEYRDRVASRSAVHEQTDDTPERDIRPDET